MTPRATLAVRYARRIRRAIADRYAPPNGLQGWCAVASLRLANKLGDLKTLRFADGHAWNEVDDVQIDITATQFGEEENLIATVRTSTSAGAVMTGGVLVYEGPPSRSYHAGDETVRGWRVIEVVDTWYQPAEVLRGTYAVGDLVMETALSWWRARRRVPVRVQRKLWATVPLLSAFERRCAEM